METLIKDVRYGLRTLLKSPVFSLVAVLSLALGIGANTAVFSLVSSLLFSPLPVERAGELVAISTTDVRNPGPLPTSYLNYVDYRDKNDVFAGVAAISFTGVSYIGKNETRQLGAQVVTGNYFDLLGVKPAKGRFFLPEEDSTKGTHPVAVLNYAFWQREFGGDADMVGKRITLNRQEFDIIGVAAEDFNGTFVGGGPDLWLPMAMHEIVQPDISGRGQIKFYGERRGLFLFLFGRLKEGISVEQAQQSLSLISSHLEQEYPNDNKGRNVRVESLLDFRVNPDGQGQLAMTSIVLMVTAGIVLLIACANVANLLLARATRRRKEIAIRLAIGASRARLVRQLMTESLMLSLVGGLVGLLVAFWTRDILRALVFGGDGDGGNQPAALDSRVLAFAIIVSLASGIIFGLAPALQASKPDLVGTLKNEIVPAANRRFPVSLRSTLVVAQVALSLVSLIGAGLFVRSLQNAAAINPGFKTDNVMLMGFNLAREGYSKEQGLIFHRRLQEQISALPGVESVAIAQNRPFGGGGFLRSVFIEGREATNQGVLVQTNAVGPGFFEAMGIAVTSGRSFDSTDTESAPLRVIINETMANQYWPGDTALGKRFKFFGDQNFREVVGVTKDTKYNSLTEQGRPFVYMPLAQNYAPQSTLHVRTQIDAGTLVGAVRNSVLEIDPRMSILNVEMMNDVISNSLGGQRANALLLAIFGGLALLLAVVGLYGVMSYMVAQRTREIGIRMALGAARGNVLGLVMRHGALLIAVGLGLGLVLAFALGLVLKISESSFAANLLFGVTLFDPLTFAVTSVILAGVALGASYMPALKATKVDPLIALRQE
jgi:predicted permease